MQRMNPAQPLGQRSGDLKLENLQQPTGNSATTKQADTTTASNNGGPIRMLTKAEFICAVPYAQGLAGGRNGRFDNTTLRMGVGSAAAEAGPLTQTAIR